MKSYRIANKYLLLGLNDIEHANIKQVKLRPRPAEVYEVITKRETKMERSALSTCILSFSWNEGNQQVQTNAHKYQLHPNK